MTLTTLPCFLLLLASFCSPVAVAQEYAEHCAKKQKDCEEMCGGKVKDSSCSAITGQWTCQCGSRPVKTVAEEKEETLGSSLGSKTAESAPFKEACAKKKTECEEMCKGVIDKQSCDDSTGKWDCQCGTKKDAEPFKGACETKKKECSDMCKGNVKTQTCSAITGKWDCKCAAEEAPLTNLGSSKGSSTMISVKIASLESLLELIRVIDTKTWQVLKTITISGITLHAGDVLLREHAMAGKSSVSDLTSLSIGSELTFKHVTKKTTHKTTTITDKTTSKTAHKTENVNIAVSSKTVLKTLASHISKEWKITKTTKIGGITLHKGDEILHEKTLKGVSVASSAAEILQRLSTANIVVKKTVTSNPSSRRRRRLMETKQNQCEAKKTKCSTDCGGATAMSFSCSFSTSAGTKWECKCRHGGGGETETTLKTTRTTATKTVESRVVHLEKLVTQLTTELRSVKTELSSVKASYGTCCKTAGGPAPNLGVAATRRRIKSRRRRLSSSAGARRRRISFEDMK